MSFLEIDVSGVSEPKVVPEGSYDLIITDNPEPKEKNGKFNLLCILSIEGHPEAANVMHNIALPHESDEDNTRNFKLLMLKRFCHHFGIDTDGGRINTESFSGARGSMTPLTVELYEGAKKNAMKLPPLPQEG